MWILKFILEIWLFYIWKLGNKKFVDTKSLELNNTIMSGSNNYFSMGHAV